MSNQGSATHHIVSHDPATYQPPAQDVPKYIPTQRKRPMLVLATAGLLLITAGLVLLYLNKDRLLNQGEQTATPTNFAVDDSVIATVGAENIFAQDLKYEQSFYPEDQKEALAAGIKQRLINESVILQAGAEANIIQLSPEVFNRVDKDREKRRELAAQVKDTINNQAAHKIGAVVSIWFMNFEPGSIGYDEGKKLAYQKISALQQAVSSGKMTIKQAGDAIKADTTLAQVDTVYKGNAYFEFDTREGEKITFDPDFNQLLLGLSQGETSKVYTAQDYEKDLFDQPKKDAVYMFGQVTEIQADGTAPFEQWLEEQKNNYAITES
ncbi:MAG: hypothetical protein COY81_05235 [Candidatus Pacebacteria bacterium CG_4_10_14_0_8_um_filter_43_12]|nr:MAG: hypothetical protein COY81_05235 [Candidatus Pacebacteria bacterium CG_4_10_14_0_8_um_filter_43_12]